MLDRLVTYSMATVVVVGGSTMFGAKAAVSAVFCVLALVICLDLIVSWRAKKRWNFGTPLEDESRPTLWPLAALVGVWGLLAIGAVMA